MPCIAVFRGDSSLESTSQTDISELILNEVFKETEWMSATHYGLQVMMNHSFAISMLSNSSEYLAKHTGRCALASMMDYNERTASNLLTCNSIGMIIPQLSPNNLPRIFLDMHDRFMNLPIQNAMEPYDHADRMITIESFQLGRRHVYNTHAMSVLELPKKIIQKMYSGIAYILKGYTTKGMPQRSIRFKKMKIGKLKSVQTTLTVCIHGQNYFSAIFEFCLDKRGASSGNEVSSSNSGNEVSSSGNEVSSSGNEVSSSGNEVSSSNSGNEVPSYGNGDYMDSDFLDGIDFFFDSSQSSGPSVEILNEPESIGLIDIEMQDRVVDRESWLTQSSSKTADKITESKPVVLLDNKFPSQRTETNTSDIKYWRERCGALEIELEQLKKETFKQQCGLEDDYLHGIEGCKSPRHRHFIMHSIMILPGICFRGFVLWGHILQGHSLFQDVASQILPLDIITWSLRLLRIIMSEEYVPALDRYFAQSCAIQTLVCMAILFEWYFLDSWQCEKRICYPPFANHSCVESSSRSGYWLCNLNPLDGTNTTCGEKWYSSIGGIVDQQWLPEHVSVCNLWQLLVMGVILMKILICGILSLDIRLYTLFNGTIECPTCAHWVHRFIIEFRDWGTCLVFAFIFSTRAYIIVMAYVSNATVSDSNGELIRLFS